MFFSFNIFDYGSASAEVLYPPRNIPFLNDVEIVKYSDMDALQYFNYSGNWSVKTDGTRFEIVAEPSETYAILLSKDQISSKPKSFKFDFIATPATGNNIDYAFFYGFAGVAVKDGIVYSAVFDNKGNVIEIDRNNAREIVNRKNNEYNTLDINTGYDVFNNVSCVMYINGNGVVIKNPSTDSHFGIYLGSGSSIIINNIRWGRGRK